MGDYSSSRAILAQRGVTLNILKEEMHALNMRMLLAMQMHDTVEQEELGTQMAEVQKEIDQISCGR